MVRIAGFHPADPGSSPGCGIFLFMYINMVKPKKHSVVFDEGERNTFLKKFIGSKGAKIKKAKRDAEKLKIQQKQLRKKKKFLEESEPAEVFDETKYEDIDKINNLHVQVTTKVFKH